MALTKLGKDRWKLVVEKGYDAEGKRMRVTENFPGLKHEAEERLAQMKAEIKGGYYIENKKITMERLLNEWLEKSKFKLTPKTYDTYVLYSKNIIKCIGHIQLKDVNPRILEEFYNELRVNKKYAEKTILHHYNIINTSLNKATIWGYIVINPNLRVEKPKVIKKDISFYEPDEVKVLLKALQGEPLKYQALISLAIDIGARRGELLALKWSDINFKDGSVYINKSIQYTPKKGIFEKETKTENSNRKVYISDTVLEILKKYETEQLRNRLALGNKWINTDRIFTKNSGDTMHPDTAGNILYGIIKRHNLKEVTFHGLRHTYATLMVNLGVQSQIISKMLGHSSIQTTHSIYSHFFESEFKETANKMNEFLKLKQ